MSESLKKPVALVVGGAGYIGSQVNLALVEHGWKVVVLDNLSTGHKKAVVPQATLLVADVADLASVGSILKRIQPDVIFFLAAKAYVNESLSKPDLYFSINVARFIDFLNLACDVLSHQPLLIFSSSCTVYGNPDSVPIDESMPFKPAANPYGETKQMCERILYWMANAGKLRYVSLRFFNAAGAYAGLGEHHEPETHLIPRLVAAAINQQPFFIFGSDYPTADGTCVRDFVHVRDLAIAHVKAALLLLQDPSIKSEAFNLGSGRGFSVLQVVNTLARIINRQIKVEFKPRREGDVPILVASIAKAKSVLNWEPVYSSLEQILKSAYEWHLAHPEGYK